jgi:hypothetical protein
MIDYKNRKPKEESNWKFVPHIAFIFAALFLVAYIGA